MYIQTTSHGPSDKLDLDTCVTLTTGHCNLWIILHCCFIKYKNQLIALTEAYTPIFETELWLDVL